MQAVSAERDSLRSRLAAARARIDALLERLPAEQAAAPAAEARQAERTLKQLEVSILGQVYVLACPEGGETLLAAAVASVDQEMSAIRSAGKVKARERIAVLAALNLAYQLAERGAGAQDRRQRRRAQADSADLDALIRRVDAALADDGQLL